MAGPDEKLIKEIGPIWRELWGGVWHTTRPDRFLSILDDGAVLPAPPNSDHKGTFAQSLGGVSLFDFRELDRLLVPSSAWRTFVPYKTNWAGAVWLEVDHERSGKDLISAGNLIEKWHDSGNYPNILPRLEGVHIGKLPLSNIRRAIFICAKDRGKFHEFDCSSFDRTAFEDLLPDWRDDFEFASLPYYEQIKRKPIYVSNVPHDPDLA